MSSVDTSSRGRTASQIWDEWRQRSGNSSRLTDSWTRGDAADSRTATDGYGVSADTSAFRHFMPANRYPRAITREVNGETTSGPPANVESCGIYTRSLPVGTLDREGRTGDQQCIDGRAAARRRMNYRPAASSRRRASSTSGSAASDWRIRRNSWNCDRASSFCISRARPSQ